MEQEMMSDKTLNKSIEYLRQKGWTWKQIGQLIGYLTQ